MYEFLIKVFHHLSHKLKNEVLKKILKILFISFFCYVLICFLVPFIRFLHERSIENQINYLQFQFKDNLGEKLQNIYPEGKLFSNLVFALSIIKYSEFDKNIKTENVENAILRTISKDAAKNFDDGLKLKYGAFYNGWINYTLKKYIESELFIKSRRQSVFNQLHKEFSERIVWSQLDSICLLETYSGSVWPADNLICIASLDQNHNKIKKNWLEKIKNQSDEFLINHSGSDVNEIRGSSLALINFLLIDIDSSYFAQSYTEYKKRFHKNIFGVTFVREFEANNNFSDIDSGPVVLGAGSVATIMNSILDGRINRKRAKLTYSFLNIIGLPINILGKKYYLLKKEPMYDIFMLWNSVYQL